MISFLNKLGFALGVLNMVNKDFHWRTCTGRFTATVYINWKYSDGKSADIERILEFHFLWVHGVE